MKILKITTPYHRNHSLFRYMYAYPIRVPASFHSALYNNWLRCPLHTSVVLAQP